jgi:hypothetical protein
MGEVIAALCAKAENLRTPTPRKILEVKTIAQRGPESANGRSVDHWVVLAPSGRGSGTVL